MSKGRMSLTFGWAPVIQLLLLLRIIIGFPGLMVCWTAQVSPEEPADRDDTDRAGSYDINACLVSTPRPPPTI